MTQTKFKKFPFNLELAKKITNECYEEFIKELDAASTATTKKRTTMTQTTMEAIQPKTEIQFKRVPFDLELAKKITNHEIKGQIVTEAGFNARIICFDRKCYSVVQLLALIKEYDYDYVVAYKLDGKALGDNVYGKNLHIEVPTYYKDYSNFEPCKLNPCVARNYQADKWEIRVCAGRDEVDNVIFYNQDGGTEHVENVLPLDDVTERLIGTKKSYEELIEELDAASTKNE